MLDDNGSHVIGLYDWTTGRLRVLMVKATFYGSIIPRTNEATDHVHQAYRWKSRQAARQALNGLRERHSFGIAWEVINLRRLGTK